MGSVAPRGGLTSLWLPQCSLLCTPIFSACCSVLAQCEQSCEPPCSTEPLWGQPGIVCL